MNCREAGRRVCQRLVCAQQNILESRVRSLCHGRAGRQGGYLTCNLPTK